MSITDSLGLPKKSTWRQTPLGVASVFALAAALVSTTLTPAGAQAGLPVWNQIGADLDGQTSFDLAGAAVAVSADGNRVIIGTVASDDPGMSAGHAEILEWNGSSWNQLGNDITGEASGDSAGSGVAVSADGNTVVVGSPLRDGNGVDSGHARIFTWDGTAWTQVGASIEGETAGDLSGRAVALSDDGDTVIIGSPGETRNGDRPGRARIYRFDGTSWNQLGPDLDGEAAGDRFGLSVAISANGNRVAIGAPDNDGNGASSGHVRIFNWNGSVWNQLGSDIDGEALGDTSGWATALSADGNTVAIGASANDGNGTSSGHVRVYSRNGNQWNQVGGDIDGETASDRSGSAISLSDDGETIAIGAPDNDGNGSLSGHVRIFELNGNSWSQTVADIDGEAIGDRSGGALALSGDGETVIIGSLSNSGGGQFAGHARVFRAGSPFTRCNGQVATIDMNSNGGVGIGTPGNDVILGTSGADTINGLGGDDLICGGDGDDVIIGGGGVDTIFGGDDDDVISGQAGNDLLHGERGSDRINGGTGDDQVFGGPGNDDIRGQGGDDDLRGEAGVDQFFGGSGDDVIRTGGGGNAGTTQIVNGQSNNDTIFGSPEPDVLDGGPGQDEIHGNQGADVLNGGRAADDLFGGTGNDILNGGPDRDDLSGGGNVDTCNGGGSLLDTADATCETTTLVP